MRSHTRLSPWLLILASLFIVPASVAIHAAQLQWTPATVVVDLDTAQNALISVSTDGHVLVFNSTDPRIVNLAAGKILLLEHLGARTVTGVLRQGPITAVATNSAALTDLVQEGTIQFPNTGSAPTIRWQQDTDEYGLTGEVNDWKFHVQSNAENNDLDYSFVAAKDLGGLSASVNGKGEMKNNGFSFLAAIHQAKLQKLLFSTPIEGTLRIDWAAMTSGPNTGIGENRLEMPVIFKELFEANGLPFLYQIGANLIFTPGLGGKKDAVSGGYEVKFKGTGGFTANAQEVGAIKEMEADPPSVKDTTSSALAPHGIVVAVNAPKVSLSFGLTSFMEAVNQLVSNAIKNKSSADAFEPRLGASLTKDTHAYFKTEGGAYVQWVAEYDYTGSGPMSMVPCTITHMRMLANSGIDAKLLGLSDKSPAKFDLYDKTVTTRIPDLPICGQK